MEESDIQLIRRAKRGDTEAFTLLVRNYKNYIMQTAAAILSDRMEAEDVTQETFVRAYLSLKQLRKLETFPSWLATIATRLALDAAKRKSRAVSTVEDVAESAVDETYGGFRDVENRIDVLNLLEDLTPEERTIIVLRELQDRSYQDIAQILGIPIGTVRSRLHTARQSLRARMKHWERDDSHDHL
ncbi:RNA polymerase sigma factor [Alicyclobacillus dauci]|uniref:RNA polymerase sigma factor n=1 Tax=Alicyclobacillus dauci TaxID=1475485 RepID=A0ABY6Z6G5_9BACL|nr:sigma-70 family RNA polymerase sigma factor [Alicyclobacillus dauci]WAH38364.1 sigma-70 family RNA polymerase sigma factor [Alicyclobacillus dauci]